MKITRPGDSEFVMDAFITVYRTPNGQIEIYEAQAGGLLFDYEDALALRQALDEYLALDKEALDSRRQQQLTQMLYPSTSPTPRLSTTKRNPAGFVYLVEGNGHHKIGRSKDPSARIEAYLTLPFPVTTIVVIQTDDMYALEIELHERFATKRINGEWFNLSPEDVEYIKSLTNGS